MAAQTRALFGLTGRQHGVAARRQLIGAGWTRGAIEEALASGRLHRLHRGVYAVGRPELSDRGRWLGAVLACGPGAVLSHRSAAALWELRPWPARLVEVTCPAGARRPLVIAHRSTIGTGERTALDHIPVTTVARTLLDLAEVVPAPELDRAIHQAYRLRRFSGDAVAECIAAHPARNGAARLRRALTDHPSGASRTRSWLEIRMLALCREHGLPLPQVNVQIEGRERDLYWPDHALVVEVDGRHEHLTPLAFETDHERDIELSEAGYTTRRFTYRQLTERPEWVAARIRAALGRTN